MCKTLNEICESVGATPCKPENNTKLGIALQTIGKQPINGLRHKPQGETNGWYLWCGEELLDIEDFFSPLHTEHLDDYLPLVREFLDLPPGYRFLIDDKGYRDVWFDELLLIESGDK